jgi:hypothetical protein
MGAAMTWRGAFLLGNLALLWLTSGPLWAGEPPGQGAPQGLGSLTPEERRRIQENVQRWQQLSPEEQTRLRQQMDRWKQLPPQDRERVQKNYERWQQMPPEQREQLRERLRNFREMPPEERQRAREEFRGRRNPGGAGPADPRRP